MSGEANEKKKENAPSLVKMRDVTDATRSLSDDDVVEGFNFFLFGGIVATSVGRASRQRSARRPAGGGA